MEEQAARLLRMCNITSATFYWENKYQRSNQIQAEENRWGVTRSHYSGACGWIEEARGALERTMKGQIWWEDRSYHIHLWKIQTVAVLSPDTTIHITLTWDIELLPKSHQPQIQILSLYPVRGGCLLSSGCSSLSTSPWEQISFFSSSTPPPPSPPSSPKPSAGAMQVGRKARRDRLCTRTPVPRTRVLSGPGSFSVCTWRGLHAPSELRVQLWCLGCLLLADSLCWYLTALLAKFLEQELKWLVASSPIELNDTSP